MAYTIISYIKGTQPVFPDLGEAETKAADAEPGPTPVESYFVWLADIDGREYAKVETSLAAMPTQDASLDYQTHDLSTEAGLRAKLDAAAITNNIARTHRQEDYPPVGDQLDEILKYFKELKAGGTTLPAGLDNILTAWEAAKTKSPKDEDI
jgi:hypothetical protein